MIKLSDLTQKEIWFIKTFNASKARECTLDEDGKILSWELIDLKEIILD